jgi:hypothetical protein
VKSRHVSVSGAIYLPAPEFFLDRPVLGRATRGAIQQPGESRRRKRGVIVHVFLWIELEKVVRNVRPDTSDPFSPVTPANFVQPKKQLSK